MNCVSYTRAISADKENMPPIKAQNRLIAKFAMLKGLRIEKEYSDTKKTKDACDGFEELRGDAIARKFDCVIFNSIYQFGANVHFGLDILRNFFIPAGINLAIVDERYFSVEHTTEENIDFLALLYKRYVRELRDASFKSSTMARRYEKFGYRYTEDGMLEIDEEAAIVVRRIFDMAESGISTGRIAAKLNEEKIPPPYLYSKNPSIMKRDALTMKWLVSKIIYILRNPVYAGKWIWTFDGVEEEYECPAIVSKEQFEKVQSLIASRRCGLKRSGVGENPFSRLIYDCETDIPL